MAGLLVIGALRPDYDSLSMFVSLLSLTDAGWQQVVNFVLSGALFVAFGFGMARVLRDGPGSTWGPGLIGLTGVGLVLAGLFATDPAQGYPPGTPTGLSIAGISWHAPIHYLGAILLFASVPAAAVVLSRRFRRPGQESWRRYSIASGVLMLLAYAGIWVVGENLMGLLQRISIFVGLLWVALLAGKLLVDPPFMSSRDDNVIFGDESGSAA